MSRLVIVIALSFFTSAFAQPPDKTVLIDQFERTPCDDFKARLDYFYNHLSAYPTSTGYVIVFGETDNMRVNVFYEGMIKGYFKLRKFEMNRLRFVHCSFRQKLAFEFWRVPPEAQLPSFPLVEWSYKMAVTAKPYKFTWEDNNDDICPDVDGVQLFVEFLVANPNAHGNIVIRDVTAKRISKKTRLVLAELTKKHRIPRKQLRVFRVVGIPDGMNQPVEYWLVPKKD